MNTTILDNHVAIESLDSIRNVLILDDEEYPRRILRNHIEENGYTTLDIANPLHVENAFLNMDFQLMICDVMMPEANGLDVLKNVRQHHPQTMVIMVSGVTELRTAMEAMRNGAIDYITKPVNLDAVMISIHRADEIYKLRQENRKYREGLELLVQQRTDQIYRFADALSEKNKKLLHTNRELEDANLKLREHLDHIMLMDKVSTVGLLSSMLIHGIANPLGVIQGLIEVMEKKYHDDPTTSKELGMMRDYMYQMLELVNQIRSYVRTEAIQFSKVNLTEIITNAIALAQLLAKKKNIEIRHNLPSDPAYILGNRSQLEQVTMNILQNAIHAIPEKGIIAVELLKDQCGHTVTITDNGVGIASEHKEKIFKMFFTTKPQGLGTGLGLYLSREIMLKHGGEITLSNPLNGGTVVQLSFPNS